MIEFNGVVVNIEKNRVIVRMGKRGIVIHLPKAYDSYTTKEEEKRICFKDFEYVLGGEESKREHKSKVLTLRFKIEEKEYVVYVVKWNLHTSAIHGYSDWDGDVYGFAVEGIE